MAKASLDNTPIESKSCTKCGHHKQADHFYRRSPTKLMSWCKACHADYAEEKRTRGGRVPKRCIPKETPLDVRLLEFSMPEPNSGCWLWLRSITPKGYPQLTFQKKHFEGHRASWVAFRGAIPRGMHVLHRCNNAACINPDHLYLGTDVENGRDRMLAGTARGPNFTGEDHPNAKLKTKDVLKIRASSARGVDLAKRFNVKPATISAIRVGRLWPHLKPESPISE